MSPPSVLIVAYKSCDTCRKALRWLDEHKIAHTVRPIVEEPPTKVELSRWIPASGLELRKWLNTSGQSYRALGKEKLAAASDDQIRDWLAGDGKLIKRPLLISGDTVLIGFRPERYAGIFAR